MPDADSAVRDPASAAHPLDLLLAGGGTAPASHRRRHGAPGDDDEDDGATAVEQDVTPDRDGSSGRHGNSAAGGLSAASLIARARAGTATQPSTPAHQRVRSIETPTVQAPTVQAPTVQVPVPTTAQAPLVKSRTGRNLPAAVAVGVLLGGLAVTSLLTYRPSFVALIVIAVSVGCYEIATAIATVEARAPIVPLIVGGAAMDIAAWTRGPDGLVGALLLTVLGIAIWRVADGAAGYRQDSSAGALIALYVPFLAGFAALLAHPHDGAARVILFVTAVVCSDTGGYTAGVLFGKHPMAPTVSPKKSWEGFAGSLVGAALAGGLIMELTFHQQWWKGVVFGLALAVVATLGDLGESMIKRDVAVKDMGRLLPGHGGLMDRLDSLLPCAPVAYLLLIAFLPT